MLKDLGKGFSNHICIHGIGDPASNFYSKWGLKEALESLSPGPETALNVSGFHYEPLMEGSRISLVGRILIQLALTYIGPPLVRYGKVASDLVEDTLSDVFIFAFDKKTREKIGKAFKKRLDEELKKRKLIHVWAHSQGTIFIYWFLNKYPEYQKYCYVNFLASPWGSPVLGALTRFVYKRFTKSIKGYSSPFCIRLTNVYSRLDPISGDLNNGMLCAAVDLQVPSSKLVHHTNVKGYINHLVRNFKRSVKTF